jgi:hypothetical protein
LFFDTKVLEEHNGDLSQGFNLNRFWVSLRLVFQKKKKERKKE